MKIPVVFQSEDAPRQRVTTVIPVRNGARYLKNAMDSIAHQARPTDRLVILDNASDDSTSEIIWKFLRSNPRVPIECVRHPTNIGMVSNFNLALTYGAESDCLHILAHDDFVEPEFYARVIPPLAMCEGRAMVYSALRFINAEGQQLGFHGRPAKDRFVSRDEFLKNQSCLRHVYCQSVVLKTNRQPVPIQFRDMKQACDVIFYSEWAALCSQIISIGAVLCSYRLHDRAASIRNGCSPEAANEEWIAMRRAAQLRNLSWPQSYLLLWKQRVQHAARCWVKCQNSNDPTVLEEAKQRVGSIAFELGGVAVSVRDAWRRQGMLSTGVFVVPVIYLWCFYDWFAPHEGPYSTRHPGEPLSITWRAYGLPATLFCVAGLAVRDAALISFVAVPLVHLIRKIL